MTAFIRRASIVAVIALAGYMVAPAGGEVSAATPPVGLGAAAAYAVLAGTTVTNTGPSTVHGSLGVSPGTAVTGFPPGIVSNGVIHAADANALAAKAALTVAYNDATSRTTTATISANLAGSTLRAGVYTGGALALSGTLTLDAHGDPNAVFVFQAASTLVVASSARVLLVNGAGACNVFWRVGSSATIGTSAHFAGTVLALTSISAKTNASIDGRLLARNGAVTLDANTFTRPSCQTSTVTTTTSSATGPTTTAGGPLPTIPRTGGGSADVMIAAVLALALGATGVMLARRPSRRATH